MIDTPIEYSAESKEIIRQAKDRCGGRLTADIWSSSELESVKLEIKNYYKAKQDYRCSYCYQRILVKHSAAWDTEHIVPRSLHPQFTFEPKNLCIACKDCNLAKGSIEVLVNEHRKTYPDDSFSFKIIHPHFDNYEEHISIHLDYIYRPKSDKGKFTVINCDLLRFSYGHFGFDTNLATDPKLVETMTDYLSEADQSRRDNILRDIFILIQISVSKSVLD